MQREHLRLYRRRFDAANARLRAQDLRYRLQAMGRQLEGRNAALAAAIRAILLARCSRIEQLQGRLQALSPLNILERGYALVFDSEGQLLKSSQQVRAGQEINARLHRGKIRARVTERE
jgi:exodeoxyribonuclease VII large subunit